MRSAIPSDHDCSCSTDAAAARRTHSMREALAAELETLAERHAGRERELRSAVAQHLKTRADRRASQGGADAAGRPPRATLRRTAVPHAGRDHSHPVRVCHQASLSGAEPVGSRAHGNRCHRRLRPRHPGARLRHRSALPAALQADRLGRIDRRSDSLLPLGHGPQGRPRDAHGQRMHSPVAQPT